MEFLLRPDYPNKKDTLHLNILILREDNIAIDTILAKYKKLNSIEIMIKNANYEIYQHYKKFKINTQLSVIVQFIKINNFNCLDELSVMIEMNINFLIVISKNDNLKNNKIFTDDQHKFLKKFHKISKEIFLIQNKPSTTTSIAQNSLDCLIENFIISNI